MNRIQLARNPHGPNTSKLTVGALSLYFSYETVVAFIAQDQTLKIRVNDWGPTTGKHLNALDGGSSNAKRDRLPGRQFEAELNATLADYGLEARA